jgi:uncharacterized protein (TIGR02246 family)
MRTSVPGILLALIVIAFAPAARSADLEAERQQIRTLDEQWVAAVAKKDAAASAGFYAADGMIMPPGAPLAKGPEAIAKVWGGLFQLKDFSLSFEPVQIEIAEAADVAYDIGTYALAFTGEQGPVRDKGKYVVVWKMGDGSGMVVA